VLGGLLKKKGKEEEEARKRGELSRLHINIATLCHSAFCVSVSQAI
jgi:hypothetical protein